MGPRANIDILNDIELLLSAALWRAANQTIKGWNLRSNSLRGSACDRLGMVAVESGRWRADCWADPISIVRRLAVIANSTFSVETAGSRFSALLAPSLLLASTLLAAALLPLCRDARSLARLRARRPMAGPGLKVKDGLFLGDLDASRDLQSAVEAKVTRVVNCCGQEVPDAQRGQGQRGPRTPNRWEIAGVLYLTYRLAGRRVLDADGATINEVFDFVEGALQKEEGVLIHSSLGESRSCCIMLAYLMRKYRWSLSKATDFLQSRHVTPRMNAGFQLQLKDFERRLASQSLVLSSEWEDALSPNMDETLGETYDEELLMNTLLNGRAVTPKSNSERDKSEPKRTVERRVSFRDNWSGDKALLESYSPASATAPATDSPLGPPSPADACSDSGAAADGTWVIQTPEGGVSCSRAEIVQRRLGVKLKCSTIILEYAVPSRGLRAHHAVVVDLQTMAARLGKSPPAGDGGRGSDEFDDATAEYLQLQHAPWLGDVCQKQLSALIRRLRCGPVVRLSSALVFGQSSMINVSGHTGSTIVKSRRNAAAAGATVSTQIMFNFLNITNKALEFSSWIHDYCGRVFNQDADHEAYQCSECGLNGLKCLQIVRNPLDRVVSSYVHTMSTKIHTFIEREIADFAADASFAEFIAFLKRTAATRSRYWQDGHYLPQCDKTCKHTEFDRVQHLPVESLDAGLAWFGQTENIQGLTRKNMSSNHYVKKSPRVDPGAAYLRYSEHLRDSPPSYESFLAEPSIFKDVCCLFRADIELYRKSCSSEWLQGCAECVDSCARELRRVQADFSHNAEEIFAEGTFGEGKQYIMVWHPHGSFTIAALYFISSFWARRIPFLAEYLLLCHSRDQDLATFEGLLKTGATVAVQPGGLAEQVETDHRRELIYFPRNLGFVRLALKYGTPLLPVYAFGENQLYKTAGWTRNVNRWLYKNFKVGSMLVLGLFGIPSTPLLPNPLMLPTPGQGLHVRWGRPVEVGPPVAEPPEALVQETFQPPWSVATVRAQGQVGPAPLTGGRSKDTPQK
ncbi:unnamed protein product [Prorocentrum cordatum]|uniref:Tyrosine-protein phosphatase domain-containing protein n=1 Tax=Prorocentrum cordatum TaxID=2364126 RepID=A0ABN9S2H4_9DINO|nr:unnamed protein product [Polarella glacialis]